jgi:histone H3/H4
MRTKQAPRRLYFPIDDIATITTNMLGSHKPITLSDAAIETLSKATIAFAKNIRADAQGAATSAGRHHATTRDVQLAYRLRLSSNKSNVV